MDWDADEWFTTHEHAPWVEHTLALVEAGWDELNVEDQQVKPTRVRAPPPAPMTMWQIYCRHRVLERRAAEAEQTKALWAEIGTNEKKHHDTHTRDIRLRERYADVPNHRPRAAWSEQEIVDLIACPPEALGALTVLDPRWKAHMDGMRPVELDELEYLDSLGRTRQAGFNRKAASETSIADMLGGALPGLQFDDAAGGFLGDEFGAGADADELANASEEDLQTAVDIGGDDDF